MFTQRLSKIDDEFVVVIPNEEVKRRGWQEDQWLEVRLDAVEGQDALETELRETVDRLIDEHEDALRYLAGR